MFRVDLYGLKMMEDNLERQISMRRRALFKVTEAIFRLNSMSSLDDYVRALRRLLEKMELEENALISMYRKTIHIRFLYQRAEENIIREGEDIGDEISRIRFRSIIIDIPSIIPIMPPTDVVPIWPIVSPVLPIVRPPLPIDPIAIWYNTPITSEDWLQSGADSATGRSIAENMTQHHVSRPYPIPIGNTGRITGGPARIPNWIEIITRRPGRIVGRTGNSIGGSTGEVVSPEIGSGLRRRNSWGSPIGRIPIPGNPVAVPIVAPIGNRVD